VILDESYSTGKLAAGKQRIWRTAFADPVLEAEFRQHFAAASYPKARPLVLLLAVAGFLITAVGLASRGISVITATFGLAVMLPLLTATLMLSYRPAWQDWYQRLLASSALGIGLFVTSVTLRASLQGMPYFFGAQVAWIFLVWLILGLLFRYAAITTAVISAAYIWGLYHWHINVSETLFESLMLLSVNAVGGLCCFQLESTARRSFIDARRLADRAERDGLTGLFNHRVFQGKIESIWRQSRREQTPFTILMIDIDHFKNFNDQYGHQAGDNALKQVARVIAHGAQRPLDYAARVGGEEFALVLYGPSDEYGRDLPEQIRLQVEQLAIPHESSSAGRFLTVSIGVAIVTPGPERSLKGVIQIADEALNQAKEEGRNRVIVKESKHTHIQTGRFRAMRGASA
jgi:diguanylate cyclase (GGDEF)-like protein